METVSKELKIHKHKWFSMVLFMIVSSFCVTTSMAEAMNSMYKNGGLPSKDVWLLNPFLYFHSGLNLVITIVSWAYLINAFSRYQTKKSDYMEFLVPVWKSALYSVLRGLGIFSFILAVWSSCLAMGIGFDHLDPNQTSLSIFYMESIFFGIYIGCFYLRKLLVDKNLVKEMEQPQAASIL